MLGDQEIMIIQPAYTLARLYYFSEHENVNNGLVIIIILIIIIIIIIIITIIQLIYIAHIRRLYALYNVVDGNK